jgi:hypothetical protein
MAKISKLIGIARLTRIESLDLRNAETMRLAAEWNFPRAPRFSR